ncbi:MAG: helix-turn-helix domain-containing protein [Syntrophotaleaceae bacterium]
MRACSIITGPAISGSWKTPSSVVLGNDGELAEDSLPQHAGGASKGGGVLEELPEDGLDLDAYLGSIEQDILLKALERCGGVRKKAAELRVYFFRSIRYRLAKYGMASEGDEE